MAETYEPPDSAAVPLALSTQPTVEAHWAPRRLGADAYRGRIVAADSWRVLEAGEHRRLRVAVRNDGTEVWPGGTRAPLIRLAYQWLDEAGIDEEHTPRSELPHPLAPGQQCLAPILLIAPARPGRYRLKLDLVHEFVRWFDVGRALPEFDVLDLGTRPVPESGGDG